MHVLKVRNLSKSFRTHFWSPSETILKDVSFSVKKGRVTGFLGVNGAGKTTTLKCILGLLRANAGFVEVLGGKVQSLEVRRKIGFLPERPYFYEYLSGREFLSFYAKLSMQDSNMTKDEIEERVTKYLEKVELIKSQDHFLRGYSKGMLQRLGVAQALIHNPELVILDEPMSGLDPDGRFIVKSLIREASSQGSSIFFSSHLLHDVEELCDDVVMMKAGRVHFEGSLDDMRSGYKNNYRLVYREKSSDEERNEKFASLDELNARLDILRKRESTICAVENESLSLEDVFNSMNESEAVK